MRQRPFSADVRVNASFWLLVLLAAIVSPLTVVAAILTAAALHELGHLAVMRYYGVSVKRFRLTALGAELDAPALARLSYGRELIVTLAGVTVNLFGRSALPCPFSLAPRRGSASPRRSALPARLRCARWDSSSRWDCTADGSLPSPRLDCFGERCGNWGLRAA